MMMNTALDMLTRFPAGTHHKAHRLHDAPPHWPVSGLAKTTRVPFPDKRLRDASSGLLTRAVSDRLTSAYRCGGSSG